MGDDEGLTSDEALDKVREAAGIEESGDNASRERTQEEVRVGKILRTLESGNDGERIHALKRIAAEAQAENPQVFRDPEFVVSFLDDYGEVVNAAALAVARMAERNPSAVANAVPILLERAEGNMRGFPNVALAIGRLASHYPESVEPAMERFLGFLDHDKRALRSKATFALSQFAQEYPGRLVGKIPRLIELLSDPEENVRAHAALALAEVASESTDEVAAASPQLADLLDSENPVVRENAAFALARIAAQRPDYVKFAIPKLNLLLGHASRGERGAAALALAYILDGTSETGEINRERVGEILEEQDTSLSREAEAALSD